MNADTPISLAKQLLCAQRELSMRLRVYPPLVARGKMDQEKAAHETATMAAICETLQGLVAQDQLSHFAEATP